VSIVTGAASGIGRAVALRMAARGAFVALLDSNLDGSAEIEREIRATGGSAKAYGVDVRDSTGVNAVVEDAIREFGNINSVISCAGILRTGRVTETQLDDWNLVISVNLTGTFVLAKLTIPWLEKSKGSFVAISSDAGTQGASGYAAYCASKHGVIGLVRCLALDHGPKGVRSNAICPSFVNTPMADAAFAGSSEGAREFYERLVPLGRFASANEIADVASYLTSNEASYVNGAIFAVDGGATAGYFSR